MLVKEPDIWCILKRLAKVPLYLTTASNKRSATMKSPNQIRFLGNRIFRFAAVM